jgi:hypothetical protein
MCLSLSAQFLCDALKASTCREVLRIDREYRLIVMDRTVARVEQTARGKCVIAEGKMFRRNLVCVKTHRSLRREPPNCASDAECNHDNQ